jgi:hypothetical protein
MTAFKQLIDPVTKMVSTDYILYTDDEGTVWTVPLGKGHRFEDIYTSWLAEGNTPEGPAQF